MGLSTTHVLSDRPGLCDRERLWRPLSLFVCAVINCKIDLSDVIGMNLVSAIRLCDVTDTNCTQAPKQQTAESQRNCTGTKQTRAKC